jgi:hypothetical protein
MTFPAQNAEINIIVRYDFSIQTMFAVVCRRAHISFMLFVFVCLYAMYFFRNVCTKSGSLRFWLSLCKFVRSSVILLLPLCSGVHHILRCIFALFFVVLCTLCCQFLCIFALFFVVLCTLCCQFLCIFALFFVVLCTLCCQFLWFICGVCVFIWLLCH